MVQVVVYFTDDLNLLAEAAGATTITTIGQQRLQSDTLIIVVDSTDINRSPELKCK